MNLIERIHFLHRAWRYRLRSEKFGIAFLLSRDLEGKTAVDIGANRGIYSYWMHRRVGPRGRVIAFEPQPELTTSLAQLRDTFGLKRLEIAPLGLSSQPGQLTLRRPRANWGGASFNAHEEGEPGVDAIEAAVTTLDHYFEHHPTRPVSFIKCDVEGHEDQVFRGGERLLSDDRPDLLFECHGAARPDCRVFSYLEGLGFDGFCFFGNGYAPVASYSQLRSRMHPKALVDFVFVPAERSHGLRGDLN